VLELKRECGAALYKDANSTTVPATVNRAEYTIER